jgi:hypothetical protein
MTNRAKSYAYEFFLFGIIFSKMMDILMDDFSLIPTQKLGAVSNLQRF